MIYFIKIFGWFRSLFCHQVGDHIEKIDGESLVGCRHYEVKKII